MKVKCVVRLDEEKEPNTYWSANELAQVLLKVPADAVIRGDEYGAGMLAEWYEDRNEG